MTRRLEVEKGNQGEGKERGGKTREMSLMWFFSLLYCMFCYANCIPAWISRFLNHGSHSQYRTVLLRRSLPSPSRDGGGWAPERRNRHPGSNLTPCAATLGRITQWSGVVVARYLSIQQSSSLPASFTYDDNINHVYLRSTRLPSYTPVSTRKHRISDVCNPHFT